MLKKALKLFEILIIFNSNMFQEIKKEEFKTCDTKSLKTVMYMYTGTKAYFPFGVILHIHYLFSGALYLNSLLDQRGTQNGW